MDYSPKLNKGGQEFLGRLERWLTREFSDKPDENMNFLREVEVEIIETHECPDFASSITRYQRRVLPDLTYSKYKFCTVKTRPGG